MNLQSEHLWLSALLSIGYYCMIMRERLQLIQNVFGSNLEISQGILKTTVKSKFSSQYVKKESFEIYQPHEPDLYVKCVSNKTADLNNDTCLRGKQSKQRITILVVAIQLAKHEIACYS